MKRNAISLFSLMGLLSALAFFNSCNDGKGEALQSKIDSLATVVEQQATDLDYYQSCLFIVSEGLDSIAKADSSLVLISTNPEGTVTKESIRENLKSYADMLMRQHERLNALEAKFKTSNKELSRMNGLINLLNKQIAEKEATIQKLQEKVELDNFTIDMLQAEVNRLSTENAQLTNTVSSQKESLKVAQGMLNEAYYIVGTSKELKEAGVLSSKFLGKSKINADNIDASLFTKIDISKVTRINVDDSKITIKSNHPSDSYKIVSDKKNNQSTIVILEEIDFWSLTRYLVIQK